MRGDNQNPGQMKDLALAIEILDLIDSLVNQRFLGSVYNFLVRVWDYSDYPSHSLRRS